MRELKPLVSRAKVRVRARFQARDPEQDHCSPAQAVGDDNGTRECGLLENLFIGRTSELRLEHIDLDLAEQVVSGVASQFAE